MADDMAEFYAHKIQERNLAVLERLQTRLRVLERQVQEVKADLERHVELQNYKPQIANGKLAA